MSAIAGNEKPFIIFGVINVSPLVFIEGEGNTVLRYGIIDGVFNEFDATSFALISVMVNTRYICCWCSIGIILDKYL